MTEGTPIACSLGASDLRQRLEEIAEVGADSLIERSAEGERHLLRFRSDPETRRRLEAIVAAEEKCCSFLDLSLEEQGGSLILLVSAPEDGQLVADELAAAFAGATIGSPLGILAAIVCAALVAVAVALILRRRQGMRSPGC